MDPDSASIVASIATNGAVGLVVTILFQLLRNKNIEVYAPRLRYLQHTTPAPAPGYFSLMHQLASIEDATLLPTIGLDAYVFLRFIKMCCKIGALCTVPAAIILIPIYVTGEGSAAVRGINMASMANLEASSPRLWASFLSVYFFTLTFLALIHKEYEHFTQRRIQFFEDGDSSISPQMTYSVIVENIPDDLRTGEKLTSLMSQVLDPAEIHSASVAVHMPPLVVAVRERTAALGALEDAIAAYEADKSVPEKKRPTMKISKKSQFRYNCIESLIIQLIVDRFEKAFLYFYGTETDAINWYQNRVDTLSDHIQYFQNILMVFDSGCESTTSDVNEISLKRRIPLFDPADEADVIASLKSVAATGTGFLTLHSRRAQANLAQVPVLFKQYPRVQAAVAPQPEDIIWENMPASLASIQNTSRIISAVLYAGLIFWAAILAFVAAVSTISNLSVFLPFITLLDPVSLAILSGMLPVIVLNIFISLIPSIIGAIAQYVERRKTNSAVEMQVFSWFFLYQLANVFLIVLGGSIFDSLNDFIGNPLSVVTLLGKAVPSVSVFFINFTICAILGGVPLMYLRIVPLLVFNIYRRLLNPNSLTRRAIVDRALAKACISNGVELPSILYILCILVVYWAVSPILLAVCTVYFAATYLAFKYQFMFISERRFESGGKFWYGLYRYSMIILMASTILSIVFMAIKQGIAQTILLVPLPIIIKLAQTHTESEFKELSLNMPLSSAVDIDVSRNKSSGCSTEAFKVGFYKPPEILASCLVNPYPYRIDGEELLTAHGTVSDVYAASWPEGMRHSFCKCNQKDGIQIDNVFLEV